MFISKSQHIYYIFWAGTGSSLAYSSLHGYRDAWQKQMALGPSSPQVETEEHQSPTLSGKKDTKKKNHQTQNKWKREGMNLWKYRRGECLWKSSASSYHSCSLLLTPINFFFIFTAKESVLCCILCCSAAYLYRRQQNSLFNCEWNKTSISKLKNL